MGKVYLRKVESTFICKDCYFQFKNCGDFFKNTPHYHCDDKIYKKISEKHAKKLLKSGKCKIVNPSE